MRRLLRTLTIVATIILLLLVLTSATGVWAVRRPFPQLQGEITVAGLTDDIVIRRDAYGVAHIYAENEADLFFGQGFVEAQDRFWQMEFFRHIGQGRVAEIVGEPALESDRFIRNLGWNRIAAATDAYYQAEHPDVYAILEAYAAGVNAYLAEQGNNVSFNRTVLTLVGEPWEIEPWEPVDTISWALVMAWDLRGAADVFAEQQMAQFMATFGADMFDAFYPGYPADRPVIAPTDRLTTDAMSPAPAALTALDWARLAAAQIGRMPEDGFALGNGLDVGSNNWVIAGDHSASGSPLLANDTHLATRLPGIWYTVALHSPTIDVAGLTFAGAPGVIIGHNQRIAWGVTNFTADSQDVYIEKINPDNPNQYEFEGEWRDMEIVEEVIRVNGGEPETLTVRLTHHGPLLNNIDDTLTEALSVRWTAAEPSRLLSAVVGLNRAQNYAEFRQALSNWDTSAQNVVYVDVDGNIAYQATGRYPIRAAGHDGLMPVPGWTGEYEWQGWIPFETMPAVFNPPEGYIVTANNAVVDAEFPYPLSRFWAAGDRAQRIDDMLVAATREGGITVEQLIAMQMDSAELLFDSYRPLLETVAADDPAIADALERLLAWDGQATRDSVAAALFQVMMIELAQRALDDELAVGGDEYRVGEFSFPQRVVMHRLADDPAATLWDDVTTAGREEAADILALALADTVDWFEQNVGGSADDWRWGAIHHVTFKAEPLGESGIGLLERLLNRGPFEVDGGGGIVNATAFRQTQPAHVVHHPSQRIAIDLADFDRALVVLPTGQSGHPFHSNYIDQAPLWADGATIPLFNSLDAVMTATENTLTLRPAAGG